MFEEREVRGHQDKTRPSLRLSRPVDSLEQFETNLPISAEVRVGPRKNAQILQDLWGLVPGWSRPVDQQEKQPRVDELPRIAPAERAGGRGLADEFTQGT